MKQWCSSRAWWYPAKTIHGKPDVEEVAERTIRVLKRTVPAAVPGIAFLSGGQSAVSATEHLNAMQKLGPPALGSDILVRARACRTRRSKPGRAKTSNVSAAQKIFHHRAKMNSAARNGSYSKEMENSRTSVSINARVSGHSLEETSTLRVVLICRWPGAWCQTQFPVLNIAAGAIAGGSGLQ